MLPPKALLPIRLDCPVCGKEVPTIEAPGFRMEDGKKIKLMVRMCLFCEFHFEVRERTPYELKKYWRN